MVHLAPVPEGMEVVGVLRTRRAVTKPRARCWPYAEKAKRKRAMKRKWHLTRRLGGANTGVCVCDEARVDSMKSQVVPVR